MTTLKKLTPAKDEKGNFIYDETAIFAFRKKCMKQIERQNKKIRDSINLQSQGYTETDPHQFAELQVSIYKHTFRIMTEVNF